MQTREKIVIKAENGQVIELEPSVFTKAQLRYLPFKRLIDILGAFCALVILFPVFLITAIAVRLDSRGSIFFRHVRVGRNGIPFEMLKFRSMVDDALIKEKELHHLSDTDGPFFKMKDDPRVTKVGRFIRKYSVDELPQFWNVLLGHMSLVGPRPLVYREIYELEGHAKNLSVKPGLTCFWQVSGRSNSSAEQRIELDAKYIEKLSLAIDIILLCKTPMAIVKGEGAY